MVEMAHLWMIAYKNNDFPQLCWGHEWMFVLTEKLLDWQRAMPMLIYSYI